jgi:hypothetical protein
MKDLQKIIGQLTPTAPCSFAHAKNDYILGAREGVFEF